ncbi:hypothetical protein [Rhodococcus globerulus]|uniref:hypothetical protein n=1 Tax=Rhodococcus globerulus TaxID=33008 RepID=UPI001C579137|nr:hypothetical protein [Rhodococcus globerulus]QXW00776.1 hypothetical protein KYT97_20585 [Rhodococcus globerulus]
MTGPTEAHGTTEPLGTTEQRPTEVLHSGVQTAEAFPEPTHPTTSPPTRSGGSRKPFLIGVASGIVATAVVAGLGFGINAALQSSGQDSTFDIAGTISLTSGATTASAPSGYDCVGTKGYDDLSPGAAVKISDEAGKLLAKGTLDSSTGGSSYCVFSFTVSGVPRGSKFYEVEIAHRGGISYTEEEAADGVGLTLGSS